jgi:hypothetical protein
MSGVLQEEPLLAAVYDFYVSRRGRRPMPSRVDIDPLEMPRFVLPYLTLLDVVDGGARFRWRLTGTEVVSYFGRDATGRFGEDVLSGDHLAFANSLVAHVCRCRLPVYAHVVFHWPEARTMAASRLYLPLGDEAAGVTQILGAHSFGTKPGLARNPATLLNDARGMEELMRVELLPG